MIEVVLPPLICAYGIFVLMVLAAWRRPVPRPRRGSGWLGSRRRGMVGYLAATTAGGFMVFLAIVLVFHALLGGERDAVRSALLEGSFLALSVFVLFAGAAASPGRRRRGR